jgi:hypothetical protein
MNVLRLILHATWIRLEIFTGLVILANVASRLRVQPDPGDKKGR